MCTCDHLYFLVKGFKELAHKKAVEARKVMNRELQKRWVSCWRPPLALLWLCSLAGFSSFHSLCLLMQLFLVGGLDTHTHTHVVKTGISLSVFFVVVGVAVFLVFIVAIVTEQEGSVENVIRSAIKPRPVDWPLQSVSVCKVSALSPAEAQAGCCARCPVLVLTLFLHTLTGGG